MTRTSAHRGLAAIALLISVAACEADPRYTDPPRDSYTATTLTLRSNNRDTTVVAATVDPTFFASTGLHALLVLPKGFDFPSGTGVWVQRGIPVGK